MHTPQITRTPAHPATGHRVNVPVAMSPAMADTLSDLARRAGMSRSAVMRVLLAAGIEHATTTGAIVTSKMTVDLDPPAEFDPSAEPVETINAGE